jgi:hypothetical protein
LCPGGASARPSKTEQLHTELVNLNALPDRNADWAPAQNRRYARYQLMTPGDRLTVGDTDYLGSLELTLCMSGKN